MKKFIVLILSLTLVLALVGCSSNEVEEITANNEKNSHQKVFEVMENTVDFTVELAEEDANVLKQIINNGNWTEGTVDCAGKGCTINLKGHMMYYHFDCGTFIKYNLAEMEVLSYKKPDIDEIFVLSENDKTTVNNILQKYITLGTDDIISE